MAGLSLEEFEQRVMLACAGSPAVKSVALLDAGLTWIRLRDYLADDTLVDVFYNQRSGKTSFAQIRNEARIFGADNTGGWHWHPAEDPERHVLARTEITFEKFLAHIEATLKR